MRDWVLDSPERALRWISIIVMGLDAGALAWFGVAARRFLGSTAWAMAAQAFPLCSMAALQSIHRVTPEPLLHCVSLVLGAAVLRAISHGTPIWGRFGVAGGVVTALGLATKVTFAPILVVPLGLLWGPGGRGRLVRFAIAFGASLAVFLLPALGQSGRVVHWLWVVATANGDFKGRTPPVWSDPQVLLGNVWNMARAEPVTAVVGAAGIATVLVVFTRGSWKGLDSRGRYMVAALTAVAFAQCLQFALVATRPGPRYLIPAIGLSGTAVCLIVGVIGASRVRARVFAGRFMALLTIPLCAFFGTGLQRQLQARRADSSVRQNAHAAAERALGRGGILLTTYEASSVAQALYFGSEWAGGRYDEDIALRYPNFAYLRGGFVQRGRHIVPADQLRAWAAEGILYYQGPSAARPPEFGYQAITRDLSGWPEAVWRVTLP